MSGIKFLYKSQYKVTDDIIQGLELPVTSGAVYNAVNNIEANALFKSGYFTEGIIGAEYSYLLSLQNDTLRLQKGSTVYVPIGKEGIKPIFKAVTIDVDIETNKLGLDNYDAQVFVDTTAKTFVYGLVRQESTSAPNSAVQKVFAQELEPAIARRQGDDGTIWWNTNTNRITRYTFATDSWEEKEYSLPLALVAREAGVITNIITLYNHSGVCGNMLFILPGLSGIAPTGRTGTRQSTYNTELIETDEVLVQDILRGTDEIVDGKMYLTTAKEIIGPMIDLVYDKESGYCLDGEGNKYECFGISTITTTHVVKESASDPLCVSSYTERTPITVADSDDIDYIINLVGSTQGITIDELSEELLNTREELKALIESKTKEVSDQTSKNFVGLDKTETIKGTKTFANKIVGNLQGRADKAMTTITSTSGDGEIIPTGLKVYSKAFSNYTDDEKSTLYSNSTVRIGYNYVAADTFRGQATRAGWADLAEVYEADADYSVGTLVRFGGEKEITLANFGECNAVISEKPAYLMNADAEGLPIALAGRVKVRVMGPCKKFDKIVLHEGIPGVGVVGEGKVIARALEDKDLVGEGLVLCVVQFSLA